MAHDDSLYASAIGEGSHLHVTFFRMRNGQHARAFAVQSTETILVVAGVQAVHKGEVFELIHVSLRLQYHDHALRTTKSQSDITLLREINQ